ncbi:glycosyl transferase [Leptolyngbya sp. Heron Island J]|uniref:glycosyltransferase family 2 protein n=1 Tax=Leptolyngbya sp. Heron Island J TaxID=1385935 RepID=UPI0003B9BC7E|nr:glycosyltransferase family 2 protein [Leptolyngbya sp. Heron Island J]ESA32180.1 glycosyl transferase [Leptolyngbya sp. Heron Island J]
MSTINISIVIPVYNGGGAFYACLGSIGHSARPPDEIVVVSDGDTDGSWQVAEEFGTKVLRLGSSGGPARARNIGAKAAQGDVIFFMDADVTLHPDTLSLVEQRFQEQPELAALIGSYDDAPGAENFLSQYKNLFHHYTHQTSAEIASTFWGACGAIRRSVFLAIEGFDETYTQPCIEDIELGYRLKRMGYEIRLYKDIQVKHLKRWEARSLLKADIFYRAIPWATLLIREQRFDADLNLNYTNRLSVLGVFALIVTALAGCFFAWIWWLTAATALGLLLINFNVYRFFCAKRGGLFTLRVIPWHWLYFFYGGSAFVWVLMQHYFGRFL